ncbi:THAP domain-containing protein 4 [Esox lucius]|uniref:THAP-type domain-containing protein n=1 Tax=Esox lucius TaxID=8010 RepID=A0A3P8Z0T9_ESOLU|nr:THAP domain-containing protein 4 [Esox lucius]
MVWCSVPGCADYKKAQTAGVTFHRLPAGDIPRSIQWLVAIRNAAYNVNTPVEKYPNVRVCSQHFKPEDFETDMKSQLMGLPGRRTLKSDAIPSIFPFTSKRKASDQTVSAQQKRIKAGTRSPSSAAASTSSAVQGNSTKPDADDDVNTSFSSADHVDILDESFWLGTKSSSHSDEGKTSRPRQEPKCIVLESKVMELMKFCQTCGRSITSTDISHIGTMMKVKWGCNGGHTGTWTSGPDASCCPRA